MLELMLLQWLSCTAPAFHSDDPGSIPEIDPVSFQVKWRINDNKEKKGIDRNNNRWCNPELFIVLSFIKKKRLFYGKRPSKGILFWSWPGKLMGGNME